ncbi:replication initiation factor domain-containing protein [Variovorax boronicumulans]|nr:replication initiation factor domain-containing protein [Variovorax boronicumulans]OEZ30410.1 hypothetical protein AO062_12975 [Variovorax boronicumulans]
MDSGDLVELLADRRGFHAVLHPPTVDTVPPGAALIDAVAFTIVPPDERSYTWVLDELRQFMVLETIEPRRGMFGFRYSARIGDSAGVIAWGGESQRGRVYVSLMGKGCSMVNDWPGLAGWLEQHRATLKRADAAYDDFDGQMVSIAWAEAQYRGDGFNAGGRKPAHQTIGDWLDGDLSVKGRTLGIGNRASGKYCRIYEKGKQLGDPTSAWSRVEVEWRDQDRHIPYDILTRPGHYLAGAYPCLAFLNIEQSKIRTISKGAQIAFERAIENARQHCGKLVNLALDVFQGDYAEVVQRLIRPGYPGRVDPFSYHVSRSPSMLDSSLVGVA